MTTWCDPLAAHRVNPRWRRYSGRLSDERARSLGSGKVIVEHFVQYDDGDKYWETLTDTNFRVLSGKKKREPSPIDQGGRAKAAEAPAPAPAPAAPVRGSKRAAPTGGASSSALPAKQQKRSTDTGAAASTGPARTSSRDVGSGFMCGACLKADDLMYCTAKAVRRPGGRLSLNDLRCSVCRVPAEHQHSISRTDFVTANNK